MLEDDFTWVLRKALIGKGFTTHELASRAELPENEVTAFSQGHFNAEIARKLASVLGLNQEAFATHPSYLPQPISHPSIKRIDMPYGGERVNAWLIRAGEITILFDTGYEPQSCAEQLQDTQLDAIFITHGHVDHVGGIPSLLAKGNIIRGSEIEGTTPIHPSASFALGPLTVRACDLSGHANPSLGYHIDGLGIPVLIVGDAIFAGSIGGCRTPQIYQHALRQLDIILSPLPAETILLPGHGPATTLGEERVSNPFL